MAIGAVPAEVTGVTEAAPSTDHPDGPEEKQTTLASRIVIFAVVSTGCLMPSLDSTIVAGAFPTINRDLHASINWSAWTITIYSLGQIVVMPLAGKMSDQFGRKRMFLAAVGLFTMASLCCALASNIYELAALRGLQAVGGGSLVPVAYGIVADTFGRDRDRAIGMITSIFPIGGMIGPLAGALIIYFGSWRGIFLINVPIGIVVILLAIRIVPQSAKVQTERIDFAGVGMLAVTILLAIYGITVLGDKGVRIDDPRILISEALAIFIGFVFVRHSRRSRQPYIPLRFLGGKSFLSINLLNVLFGASVFGVGALIPLYGVNRYHMRSIDAATLLTFRGVGMIAFAGLVSFLMRRVGTRKPMLIGFSLLGLAFMLVSIAPRFSIPTYVWLAVWLSIWGSGAGIAGPASNNACMQLVPDQPSTIAGIRGMFRQSGGIISISISTAILDRSPNPGNAQAHIFLVYAGLLFLAAIPIRFIVPDYRGRW